MNDWNNNGHYDLQDQFLDFSIFENSNIGGTTGNSNKPEVAPENAGKTIAGSILILIILGIAFMVCFASGENNELLNGFVLIVSVLICIPIFKSIQIKK